MEPIQMTIDGKIVEVLPGTTILDAARQADIYIPTLCHHPDLPPARTTLSAGVVYQGGRRLENAAPGREPGGCGLCIVDLAGQAQPVPACSTPVRPGMVVTTSSTQIQTARQEKLISILARNRHACLTRAHQNGCSHSPYPSNVLENERRYPQFDHCELQAVANFIGIPDNTPQCVPTAIPIFDQDPLFMRDYNFCIGCIRCVRACQDLRGVNALGYVFDADGRIQLGTLAPDLKDAGCKFCTACVDVCPTGALTDIRMQTGKNRNGVVPCKDACPVGMDIPAYLRLVAQDRVTEALAVIREKVPLPGILGRICNHPCEIACRRGDVNEAVSICALARYAADHGQVDRLQSERIAPDTGKQVAVIGAGPAGLTAAFYLRKKGHAVTIYDERKQAGGMMRYGIPAFRLPADVLDNEIQSIWDLGVRHRPNQRLGKDFTLKLLIQKGFDAVFLGLGAQLTRGFPLDDCDHPEVLWAMEFLRDVAMGRRVRLKPTIVVIGGGNLAVDAAMTALRCGAKNVSLACLERDAQMPAAPRELATAVAEGITVLPGLGPHKIQSWKGNIIALDLVKCTRVVDEEGNFSPRFNKKKKTCLPADQIIMAMGQATDLSFLAGGSPIATQNGLLVVDGTLATGMDRVYAGGDVADGGGSVIHAVAAGRKAAASIDLALGGDGDIAESLFKRPAPDPYLGCHEGFARWPRVAIPEIPVEARDRNFSEIATGYLELQVRREARRCLQCDLRLSMGANPQPPKHTMAFDAETVAVVPETEGVYQLLDDTDAVLVIKGTDNLRRDLLAALWDVRTAMRFDYEEDKMYSKRESEMIQKYLQTHKEIPGVGHMDDDLF